MVTPFVLNFPIEFDLDHFGSLRVTNGHPFVLNLPPIDFEVSCHLTSNKLCNLKVKKNEGVALIE